MEGWQDRATSAVNTTTLCGLCGGSRGAWECFETDVGILLAIKDAAGGLCGNTQGGEGSKETHQETTALG